MSFQELVKNQYSSLKKNNSAELLKIRQEAFDSFTKNEFPTTKNEEWKFTNIKPLLNVDFSFDEKINNIDINPYLLPDFDGQVLVFINGLYQEKLSVLIPESGLEIQHLSQAFAQNEASLTTAFHSLADRKNIFSEINASIFQDGAFISVKKGNVVEKPVLLLFINDASVNNSVSFPRNYFSVEENAQIKIIEKYDTVGNNKSLSASVTEIFVAKNAICEHFKIQTDIETASHIGTTNVKQEANSVFTNHTISLSGDIIRNDLNVIQNGEHIETNMYGLYLLNGKTHVDNHTSVDHKFPNSYSNEFYKGVLNDQSNGVFNGKIFVRQEAQKTNAFQQNNNILLSDDAKINTKPQLEIWADDVKCSHGATTGQLDQEALFYLKARGIGKQKAKALLLKAFTLEIVDKIKIDAVKNYLESLIDNKLNA